MSVFSAPWEEEVDRLEDELAAARKRIGELEAQIKTLKALDDCPECDAKGDEPCLSGFHPSGFISPGTKYCNARLLQRAGRQ